LKVNYKKTVLEVIFKMFLIFSFLRLNIENPSPKKIYHSKKYLIILIPADFNRIQLKRKAKIGVIFDDIYFKKVLFFLNFIQIYLL
jgi:hypothetical protein